MSFNVTQNVHYETFGFHPPIDTQVIFLGQFVFGWPMQTGLATRQSAGVCRHRLSAGRPKGLALTARGPQAPPKEKRAYGRERSGDRSRSPRSVKKAASGVSIAPRKARDAGPTASGEGCNKELREGSSPAGPRLSAHFAESAGSVSASE